MGRKNKKHKKNYYYNNNYNNSFKNSSFVKSKDIQEIAFKVFGSTYYTPES